MEHREVQGVLTLSWQVTLLAILRGGHHLDLLPFLLATRS